MNSIWNNNIKLFATRFPKLAEYFSLDESSQEIPENLQASIEIIESKQKGVLTAKDDGKFLHSLYNPMREASQTVEALQTEEIFTTVFCGFGFGYAPLLFTEKFPAKTLILVEPDPKYFFTALAATDWTKIFRHENLIMAIQTGADSVVSLIEKCGGFTHTQIIQNQAQQSHAKDYFAALNSQIHRNKNKDKINSSTQEKFSKLWLKNSCKNLKKSISLPGVRIYENLGENFPFVILGAGPTLQEALPHLQKIKDRSILVATDTALRACLNQNPPVEPDFIVLADPQYYASRHIQGLKSESSILITESAAYPSVFRFPCKKIVLCSSLFPLGKFIESKLGKKGELSAGGSVSTTAWDFARLCGAKKIFFAGLDLGFPDCQTHIRGSTFEEKIHQTSTRLIPAEKSGVAALYSANMNYEENYAGEKILTDNKMKMFSWWFESKSTEFKNIASYSFSTKSLKIPGFKTFTIEDFLKFPEIKDEKNIFFKLSEENQHNFFNSDEKKYNATLQELSEGLNVLYQFAKKGISTAEKAIENRQKFAFYMDELSKIDRQILTSQFKDIASLVFPTENKLNEIFKTKSFSTDKFIETFQKSKIIYSELKRAVNEYQIELSKI